MRYVLILLIFNISLSNLRAETEVYKDTDNLGLNKKERIDSIEKYLADISKTIKSLESKFDESAKKLKVIEAQIDSIKSDENKRNANKATDLKELLQANPEYQKIKSDVTGLKFETKDFTENLKSLQAMLKYSKR